MNNIIHSSEFPSLAPSPDPTVIRDYSPITNYIQERITEKQKIRRSLAPIRPTGDIEILLLISEIVELQAVLSKIEELGK